MSAESGFAGPATASDPLLSRDTRDSVTRPGLTSTNGEDVQTRRRVTAVTRAKENLARVAPESLSGPPLPAFPTKVLPSWGRDMVDGATEALQTPPDLPASCFLGALSACAAGRAEVQIRPGWREPLSLYIVAVAEPGERKSPTMRAMLDHPLGGAEETLRESVTKDRHVAKLEHEAARARAARAREAALREGAGRDALVEASTAEAEADALQVPEIPRLLAGGDSTPEAIAGLLALYGRIAITDTEGGLFDHLVGRRTTGPPNLDAVLKAWSGDRITIDRRGRDTELVKNPALAITLMTQPVTLSRITANQDMVGRGLIGRFLFFAPPSRVGTRSTGDDVTPLDDNIADAYAGKLKDLALGLHAWTDPAVIALDPPAQQAFYALEKDIESRLAPGGDLHTAASWASKLVGQTARVAALLHLAELGSSQGTRQPITEGVMCSAIQIAGYAEAHALSALMGTAGSAENRPAAAALAKIREHGLTEFKVRDLQRTLRGRAWNGAPAVRSAISTLIDHGWADRVSGIQGEVYVAHPDAFLEGGAP